MKNALQGIAEHFYSVLQIGAVGNDGVVVAGAILCVAFVGVGRGNAFGLKGVVTSVILDTLLYFGVDKDVVDPCDCIGLVCAIGTVHIATLHQVGVGGGVGLTIVVARGIKGHILFAVFLPEAIQFGGLQCKVIVGADSGRIVGGHVRIGHQDGDILLLVVEFEDRGRFCVFPLILNIFLQFP